MNKPTKEDLLKFIADLSIHGYEGTRVHIGYMPARQYNGFGESEGFNLQDWGWVASLEYNRTTKVDFSAQGKSLEEALENLAEKIVQGLVSAQTRAAKDAEKAIKIQRDFQQKFTPAVPVSSSPYR